MTQEQKKLLEKLKWENERKAKQFQLEKKLEALLEKKSFSFLTFEESDEIQLASESWPDSKWTDRLYLQTDLVKSASIFRTLKKYVDLSNLGFAYIFFMNYNFGLVRIQNDTIKRYWTQLIEIDTDEIFCYIPNRKDFICIEKTEDFIIGKEKEGRQWIYEITFSNKKLKTLLTQHSSLH